MNFKRSSVVQLAELRDEATNALLAERASDRQRKLSLHAGAGHRPKIGARRTAQLFGKFTAETSQRLVGCVLRRLSERLVK